MILSTCLLTTHPALLCHAAAACRALKLGYGSVEVKMKGAGSNKQAAVTALHAAGLRITQLADITPVAYNGCRLRARRRV
jgi:small subunit ribosomal protein S11